MNRRAFFARALGGVAAAVAIPFLPKPAPLPSVSLRFIKTFDAAAFAYPCRFDVLYGFATVRPELACRVEGA